MVRIEGQETEGPREGQLSPDPSGDDSNVEHIPGVYQNAQSKGEEVHGAGIEIQEAGLSAERPQAQGHHRHIHRYRKIHTVSDRLREFSNLNQTSLFYLDFNEFC